MPEHQGVALPVNPMNGLYDDEAFIPQLPGAVPGMDADGNIPFDFDIPGQETQSFELGPDGNIRSVMPDEDMLPAAAPDDHNRNLAEDLDEDFLRSLGLRIVEDVEEDIETRGEWSRRFEDGLDMMGLRVTEMDDGPFPGASTAVHPLISEAIVQFWARALAELVPSDGPAKAKLVGTQSKDQLSRAERVQTYMNHEILFIDEGWYQEHSRLTFAVPYAGCAFKKVYRDEVLDRNVSIYVPAEDFIVPANVTDLKTAPRFTHRIWRTPNELKKLQQGGFYRDVDIAPPPDEEITEVDQMKLEVDGISHNERQEDARYELYETNIELELPGIDSDGSGIQWPYTVTVERDTRKVLSIYRGWKRDDPLRRRRVCWVKYSYVPGLGFYDLGLFHLIGGLQQAATGALRALLDGAATASLQGGFVAKDANLKEERLEIEPGVWKPVDATSEDLAKAFFTPPFKEPSAALHQLLAFLTDRAEKYTATTEMMTGEGNSKNAPVGSTIAMIEQAAKVFSTIHRGLHMSMAQELRLRFDLIQEYMPAEGYPYDVEGEHEGIFAQDFAPGVSIQPVSDPNIFSSAQRVAISQATYELAMANPDVLRKPVAIRRMLEALRVPDPDELMITAEPPPPMDPVSEIQALLRGEPVQAYPDQNHDAYLQHYWSFMNNPQYGGNPEVQKAIGPTAMALVGQRLAYAWATHARVLAQQVGMPPAPLLPPPMQPQGQEQAGPMGQGGPMAPMGQGMPPGPAAGGPQMGPGSPMPGDPSMGGGMAPPELIALAAAQIAPMMAQVPGLPALTGEGEGDQTNAMVAQADIQREDALAQRDDARKEAEHQAKMQREADAHASKMASEETKRQEGVLKAQAAAEAQRMGAEVKAQTAMQDAALSAQERELGMVQSQEDAEFNRLIQADAHARDSQLAERQAVSSERQSNLDSELKVRQSEADNRRKDEDAESKRQLARQQAATKAKEAAKPKPRGKIK